MKTLKLFDRLAEERHLAPAAAADQLSQMVHDILLVLRQGQTARLPGLGILRPGETAPCLFQRESAKPPRKRETL